MAALSKTRVNRAGERMVAWLREGHSHATLDDLADDYDVIDQWRAQHAYPMALCVPGLRNWVARESSLGIPPGQRLKRMPRIIVKLARHDGMKLARMQDIGGVRAVVATPPEVNAVAAKVRSKWSVVRTSDYRDEPRPDTGYRALHLMVEKRSRVVEIQLRTRLQQLWSEEIERTDDRLALRLKDGDGPPELVEYFRRASDLLWMQERDLQPDAEFVEMFQGLREQVRPYFTQNG